MPYNTRQIRVLLTAVFNDQTFTTFCFDYFREVYDQFGTEMGLLWKIQLLIDHCDRHLEFERLLTEVERINPVQYTRYAASIREHGHRASGEGPVDENQVEITLKGDLPTLSTELKFAAVGALAGVLNIPRDQIVILEVRTGSLILKVEMPTEAVHTLVSLYESDDPSILELGILKVKPLVPFRDRTGEIEAIFHPLAPAYRLVDAPAGYGKTDLLLKVRRESRKRQWFCAYVSADRNENPRELIGALFAELALGGLPSNASTWKLGLEFGSRCLRRRRADITQKGFILLVDLGRAPSETLIRALLDEFIPGVHENLRTDRFFRAQHNRFRAVLAGRYLADRHYVVSAKLPIEVLPLTPLSYYYLRVVARDYLVSQADEVINQISAHIMHISGGHPGCMASLLELYRKVGLPPDVFLEIHTNDIREIVRDEIDRVQQNISDRIKKVMSNLGMFRYLDYRILNILISKGCITGYRDEFALADALTTAYLLGWDGRLLRNDSAHRLLALQLRGEEGCFELAQQICAGYLGDPTVQMPEMWVIEYLYQSLQRFASQVQDPDQRRCKRQQFLDQEIPCALSMLVQQRYARVEHNALAEALKHDPDFRFTVNYYLRQDQYDDTPFQELEHRVEQFFRELGGANA